MITLNKHKISASIKDRYANIIYSFHFENNNQHHQSNELRFEITIDPKAFISRFEANINGEIFIGKTKEKEKASKEYIAAKQKNENAILISQPHKNIPNVFEIKTNINSNSKISLIIQIEQYLTKQFGFNQLNVQILRNFDKYNITQNFDHISFQFNIEDKSGIHDINIPMINNYDIVINEQNLDKLYTKCQIKGKIMNKPVMNKCNVNNGKHIKTNELTAKYKIKGESDESHILFDHRSNTFCHIISDIIGDSIMDEKHHDEGQNDKIQHNILIPRRVMFVIDRSGSMIGSKWKKTISSTIMAIKKLRKGYDRFGIILFDNNIEILPYKDIRGCILANDKSISDSVQSLQNKKIGGGTNINDALLKAIELIKMDILLSNENSNYKYNFFMNQIVFITDGEANDGERDSNKIVVNVQKANDLRNIDKYNKKIPIFSFGIGIDDNDSGWINDLNHSFLKSLSVNNNGFYQRIKKSTADSSFDQYFLILSKPMLSNINIKYKNKNIKQLTNTKFDTLYAGNDLIICGKIENPQKQQNTNTDYNLSLIITAITGKQIQQNNKSIIKPVTISKQIKVVITNANNYDNPNIERIWAYLKLQQFATQKLIHSDMISIDNDEKEQHSSLPLSLALKYEFVTPWTSMIVVKEKNNVSQQSHHDVPKPRKQQKKSLSELPKRARSRTTANISVPFMLSPPQQHQQQSVNQSLISSNYTSTNSDHCTRSKSVATTQLLSNWWNNGSRQSPMNRTMHRPRVSVSTLTDETLITFEMEHERNRLREELNRLRSAEDDKKRSLQILDFMASRMNNDPLVNPSFNSSTNNTSPLQSMTNVNDNNHKNNTLIKHEAFPMLEYLPSNTIIRLANKQLVKICELCVGNRILSLCINSYPKVTSTNTYLPKPFKGPSSLSNITQIPGPLPPHQLPRKRMSSPHAPYHSVLKSQNNSHRHNKKKTQFSTNKGNLHKRYSLQKTNKKSNYLESVQVIKIMQTKMYKMIEIITENDFKIRCTPSYLFWICGKGWGCFDTKSRIFLQKQTAIMNKQNNDNGKNVKSPTFTQIPGPLPPHNLQRKGMSSQNNGQKVNGPQMIHELKVGEQLLTVGGNKYRILCINPIEKLKGINVYSIILNKNDCFFANDLLVKNSIS